jgi:PQQ-like domain
MFQRGNPWPKGAKTWFLWPPYGPAGAYSASQWDAAAFSAAGGILSDKAFLDAAGKWHSGNLSSVDPTRAGFSLMWVVGSLASPVAVPTYHYDTYRTGWNNQETGLTATSFASTFGKQTTVTLDDQVDAQPLLVPGLTIAGGIHDVVYVATESNTVYAIDASSGAILISNNFGAPVPARLGCSNNGPNVGITGTPTIDLATQTLYVITYLNGSPPSYKLHALSLNTLADKITPVVVTASHTLPSPLPRELCDSAC